MPPRAGLAGVSLTFLKTFLEEHGGAESDLTAAQIVAETIIPKTRDKRCKYISTMASPHTGPATHFVSHVWACPFQHLVLSLDQHFAADAQQSPPDVFLWIDVFCISQHPAGLARSETDLIITKAAISRISGFLLCLGPDALALSRSWCLLRSSGRLLSYSRSLSVAKLELTPPRPQRLAHMASRRSQGRAWTQRHWSGSLCGWTWRAHRLHLQRITRSCWRRCARPPHSSKQTR